MTTMHLGKAIAGDAESIEWLIARLSPLLLAHARVRLGEQLRGLCDAEDLVQEAWLVTLPRLSDLDPRDGHLTPVLLRFLSTAVLHQVRNLIRRQLKQPEIQVEKGVMTAEFSAQMSGAVTRAIRRENEEIIHRALEDLEPRDREVLVLRGVEQLSNEAAGTILDLKPGTVAMRYNRALERLRGRVAGSVFDELLES